MKVTLKNDKKTVAIELPNASTSEISTVLDRAFSFLGVDGATTPAKVTVNVQAPEPPKAAEVTAIVNKAIEDEKDRAKRIIEAAKANVASRPRTLPRIGEERTLSTNLEERLGDKFVGILGAITAQEEPPKPEDHWETGIQYKDFNGVQTPTYRTYYKCPNGHKGKRYIPAGRDIVHCHTCNTKIGVRLAHENGLPNRDQWGNFYMADQEVEQ